MKVTIVHTNNKKQLLVSTKTMEKLLQRIAKDDSRLTVTHFREYVTYMESGYEYYKDMPTWMHIYPAAEFAKDENNNLKMKACNGILMLKFGNITDADGVEGVKRSVAMLPSTFAALEGADGKSVIVLVKFTNKDDLLPAEEADAERLYRIAYQQILPVYQAIAKASVLTDGPKPSIEVGSNLSFEPSMHNSFMMTLDAKPYFNNKAVAMKIDSNMHPQNQAFNTEDNQQMIPGSDTSEEEKKVDKNSVRENIMSMMQLLKSKYNFRYNTVMKFVEYMPKEKGWYGFQPVDPRVQKRMTLEVQLADIRVSIKDVRNFLESDYIKNYNPIDEYLFQCYDKWDGKDHIRALARTVPTNNPYWADWFYTWFLGMVDQWRGFTHRQYGNSVAPLLISKQGYNKSTFCRRLLPPELQWGYSDNLILSEKRQVYQAMAQFMVINLDEMCIRDRYCTSDERASLPARHPTIWRVPRAAASGRNWNHEYFTDVFLPLYAKGLDRRCAGEPVRRPVRRSAGSETVLHDRRRPEPRLLRCAGHRRGAGGNAVVFFHSCGHFGGIFPASDGRCV